MALVRKEFLTDNTWTAPGGVHSVRVIILQRLWPQLSSGVSHAGAIDGAGTLYTWGRNTFGQLSSGGVASRSTPTAIFGAGVGPFQQVIAGQGQSMLGLTASGVAYGWGDNTVGQLGNNSVTARSAPTALSGSVTFRQLSMGSEWAAGVTADGTVYAWGRNDDGQLGQNDSGTKRSTPTAISHPSSRAFRQVACGESFALAVDALGDLYAWGRNQFGQLGIASSGLSNSKSTPTFINVALGVQFKQVAASSSAAYALAENGTLYSWGNNVNGELATGNITVRSSPQVIAGTQRFRQVAASHYSGANAAFAIDDTGDLYAWGDNQFGQLGNGGVVKRSTPTAVSGSLKVVQVAAGAGFAHAMTSAGAIYGWGINDIGQLGNNTVTTPASVPSALTGGITFQAVREALLNDRVVSVKPGTAYPVVVSKGVVAFASVAMFQNQYGTAGTSTRVVLEYDA